MDPLLPAETELMEREADGDARRKIQFSVPSPVPTQLDPRQVEMVSLHADSVWKNEIKLSWVTCQTSFRIHTKCFVSFLSSLKTIPVLIKHRF